MKNILLVEDDDEIRETLSTILETEGYNVEQARNGKEGIAKLNSLSVPPCLILLDLLMPEINGYEFVERIGVDNKIMTIPVIVITAVSNIEKHRLKGYTIIKKPFALDEFIESIKRLCCTAKLCKH